MSFLLTWTGWIGSRRILGAENSDNLATKQAFVKMRITVGNARISRVNSRPSERESPTEPLGLFLPEADLS